MTEIIVNTAGSGGKPYLIVVNDSGVFLTVDKPSPSNLPVNETAIFAELKEKGVVEFDRGAIIRAIKEAAGEPVKIAEKPPVAADPEISVIVSRDRMQALLQITIPKNCRAFPIDEVFAKIKQCGVIYGLNAVNVQKAYERPGIEIVCATGQPATNGVDAIIKYHIDMENKGRPEELEDGRVDFKNLNLFTTVAPEQLLAEKIPPTQGVAGVDVLGQPVPAKPGRDIPFPVGKNVQVADGTKIIATVGGQLVINGKKINVIPVIEIRGDVDLSTGNIEFSGNVIIHGSVQSGFSVKAGGDVEIAGTVSGGVVEGRNINIRMGVQGMHSGYIRAKENVSVRFVENASIEAGLNIVVNDVVLHSQLRAGKKISVGGQRGLITGGTAVAGEEISAKTVGSAMAINTELEVGANPALRSEYQQLCKTRKKTETDLEKTRIMLETLRKTNQNQLSPKKREMLLQLTKAHFRLTGQAEAMRNRITEIDGIFTEMRSGRIKVSDTVFPGVKVVIGTVVTPIREEYKHVTFYEKDGELKTGLYS